MSNTTTSDIDHKLDIVARFLDTLHIQGNVYSPTDGKSNIRMVVGGSIISGYAENMAEHILSMCGHNEIDSPRLNQYIVYMPLDDQSPARVSELLTERLVPHTVVRTSYSGQTPIIINTSGIDNLEESLKITKLGTLARFLQNNNLEGWIYQPLENGETNFRFVFAEGITEGIAANLAKQLLDLGRSEVDPSRPDQYMVYMPPDQKTQQQAEELFRQRGVVHFAARGASSSVKPIIIDIKKTQGLEARLLGTSRADAYARTGLISDEIAF